METAFFKTLSPKQKVYLTTLGRWVAWQPIDGDLGLLVTDNDKAILDLRTLIRRNSGGVVEISGAEYTDLSTKKKEPKPPQKKWREEFSVHKTSGQTQLPPSLNPAKGVVPAVTDTRNPINRAPLPDNLRPKAR